MKQKIIPSLSTLLTVFFASCHIAAGTRDTLYLRCPDGLMRAAGIYIPSAIKTNESLPFLIWLHGGTNTLKKNKGLEALARLETTAEKFGFIAAAPSSDQRSNWFSESGQKYVMDLINAVITKYPVNQNVVVLAGVSDGATASYIITDRFPGLFKLTAAWSGSPILAEKITGEFKEGFFKGNFMIVNTGKDAHYPLEKLKDRVAELKAKGMNAEFTIYPELPHGAEGYYDIELEKLGNKIKALQETSETKEQ